MRKAKIILFLLFMNSCFCAGQNKKILILTTKNRVDSLVSILSKCQMSKDSCVALFINTKAGSTFFNFYSTDKKTIASYLSKADKDRKQYGYVKLKNQINLFVIGDKKLFDFFNPSNHSQAFAFEDAMANKGIPELDIQCFGSFRYKAGKFLIN
jgi:hypothetical protein